MQLGAQVASYERIKKHSSEKKIAKKEVPYKFLAYFIGAVLISRVTMINDTAPFGIALALSMIKHREDKLPFAVFIGTSIGYLTLINKLYEIPLYIIMITLITTINYTLRGVKAIHKIIISSLFIVVAMVLYRYFMNHYTLGIIFFTAMFHLACIVPIYFIIDYAIICSKEIKTKHLFKNEEIISMAIVISLIISGTWGIEFFTVSFRNLLALTFIMIISYTNGSAIGAATGVAMGVIVGISSNNMMNFISVYGVCGLIVGIFKDTGKWLTALSYIVIFSILKLYSGISNDMKIVEGIVTALIFLAIPGKFYDRWASELDWERKQDVIGEEYIEKIKCVFSNKLNTFSSILESMSSILNDLVDNDRLVMKEKSSALIENLADKVCRNCDLKSSCWQREFHQTYLAFGELIDNYHNNIDKMPKHLENRCIKRTAISSYTEDIVNNYIISEMWRKRLSEGRELLSGQIKNMSGTIEEILEDFNKEVTFNMELEKKIRVLLNKKNFKVKDILCYEDRNARIHIKVTQNGFYSTKKCVKELLSLINEVCEKAMCVNDEGCIVDSKTKESTIYFEETPKFHVVSYVDVQSKDGEKLNGDSYTFGKLKDGTYITVISDGMGSGPEAHRESNAAIELIEKFTENGFGKETAINTVNSVMSLRFSDDEKFSTLDLNSIDLYSGDITFMKVGAVSSLIKRGTDIDVIKSKTLPIGVLDKVDVEIIDRTLKSGDMIFTFSDGLLEAIDEEWLINYLSGSNCNNPQELSDEIMKKAREFSGEKFKDDITIITSKIYSLY